MSRASNDMSAVRMVLGPGIMYTANTRRDVRRARSSSWSRSRRGSRSSPSCRSLLVSLLVRHYGRQIHDRYEEVQAQLAEMNALVQENLAGARVVRAYAQEAHEEARFAAANETYVARNRRLIHITGIVYPGIQFLMGLGSLHRAVARRAHGGRGHRSRSGEFVAFGAYLAMLNWPMIALGWVVNLFERGEASIGPHPRDPRRAGRDPRRGAARRARGPRRRRVPRAELRLRRRADRAPRRRPRGAGGRDGRHRRPHRLRQDDAREPPPAPVGPARRGRSSSTATTCATHPARRPARGRRLRARRRASSSRTPCARTWPSACAADGDARRARSGRRRRPSSRRTCGSSRTASRRPWASAASPSRAGRSSAPRSPARSPIDPRILVLDDALSAVDTETEEQILEGLRERDGARARPSSSPTASRR